jgi:hypothetical protein
MGGQKLNNINNVPSLNLFLLFDRMTRKIARAIRRTRGSPMPRAIDVVLCPFPME